MMVVYHLRLGGGGGGGGGGGFKCQCQGIHNYYIKHIIIFQELNTNKTPFMKKLSRRFACKTDTSVGH